MATLPNTAPTLETIAVDARLIRGLKFAAKYVVPAICSLALAIASGYKVYVNDAAKRDVQFVELKTKVEQRDGELERRLSAIERDTHETREFLLNGRYGRPAIYRRDSAQYPTLPRDRSTYKSAGISQTPARSTESRATLDRFGD